MQIAVTKTVAVSAAIKPRRLTVDLNPFLVSVFIEASPRSSKA
jgi:hypothetical protein